MLLSSSFSSSLSFSLLFSSSLSFSILFSFSSSLSVSLLASSALLLPSFLATFDKDGATFIFIARLLSAKASRPFPTAFFFWPRSFFWRCWRCRALARRDAGLRVLQSFVWFAKAGGCVKVSPHHLHTRLLSTIMLLSIYIYIYIHFMPVVQIAGERVNWILDKPQNNAP